MSLFLLGIPLALANGIILTKDIKYTKLDLKIPKADYELSKQKKQIDEFLFDIFEYVGVEGDIDVRNKKITNTVYNGYNGLNKYLAEKGYRKEAIDYAINRYNNIAQKEHLTKTTERKDRIKKFERKIKYENTYHTIFESSISNFFTQKQVEHKVEKLLQYFKTHGQPQIYCNIVMDGKSMPHNHIEVWHLTIPNSATNKEVQQYWKDVYETIIGDE